MCLRKWKITLLLTKYWPLTVTVKYYHSFRILFPFVVDVVLIDAAFLLSESDFELWMLEKLE